jgi:hypothetical protein
MIVSWVLAPGASTRYNTATKLALHESTFSEDEAASMESFFSTREAWIPLFRSLVMPVAMANTDDQEENSVHKEGWRKCQARSFLAEDATNDTEFHASSLPWRELPGIPSNDQDKQVLNQFLDDWHRRLVALPVDERVENDDNDVAFVEEGRRMLAVARFHVLHDATSSNDHTLFATCWNEIKLLHDQQTPHTGSIILVPPPLQETHETFHLHELRQFAERHVIQPLAWLGIVNDFEVTFLQRGLSPAIRLLYKLNDMPNVVGGVLE